MGSEHPPHPLKTLMKAIQIRNLSNICQNVKTSTGKLQTLEKTTNKLKQNLKHIENDKTLKNIKNSKNV